jgi:6-phosphogluconolactonase
VLIFACAAAIAGGCAGLRSRPSEPEASAQKEQPHTFLYAASAAGEIEVVELDTTAGDLTRRGKVALGGPVLSLAGAPLGNLLLATTDRGAGVVSLAVDPKTGVLKSLGRAGVGGTGPMGAAVDGSGRYVAVANYGSGNVSVVPIRPDGKLAEADTFAAGRGATAVGFHPSNEVAFVVNELAGTISQYSFNPGTGALTPKPGRPLGLPGGARPRQIRCHPDGRFVYVLNETDQTVSVYTFDDRMGTLTHLAFQVVPTTPEGAPSGKRRGGSMRLGRNGKYLYVSNRAHDTIAVFEVGADTGELNLRAQVASGGQDPVELSLDASGAFLVVANRESRNLAMFRIAENGELSASGAFTLSLAPIALHTLRPPLADPEPTISTHGLLP